jgi:O-ureido-D-serine cyclo-ligase
MRIALVTAIAAYSLDEDLQPLQEALHAAGIPAQVLAWDDDTVSWSRFDLALLRSPWDYTHRLEEFLAWAARTSTQTRLLNPLDVIGHNTDKHYLGQLAAQGLRVVPSRYIEPGERAADKLDAFLAEFADAAEFVAKPCVGAGSRDAQRYARAQSLAARAHVERLQAQGRSVLLQPYLASVDSAGETALVFFDGEFSHAIRKGPLLQRDAGPTRALFAPEKITARTPGADELALARAVLAAMPGAALAYARVDLVRDADDAPCLLELELTEPSLFFRYCDGAADRFVAVLARRLGVAA